jgi:hypothetical protein
VCVHVRKCVHVHVCVCVKGGCKCMCVCMCTASKHAHSFDVTHSTDLNMQLYGALTNYDRTTHSNSIGLMDQHSI